MIPEPDLALAESLFGELHKIGFDGVGITRDTYGLGEQEAHNLIARIAAELGLETRTDAALNLYVTLPGRDRSRPCVMTGSHLDSVPRGGNYDGAAGVIAGLSVLSGWRQAGFSPMRDTTLMVVRAEESSWFPISYLGSRAAWGILPPGALDVRRADNGRPVRDHIRALGGAPEKIGAERLEAGRIARFIEVHIEQGPVLLEAGEPAGIVTGIRGSVRYRSATATGVYAHSGATPRSHRKDAVLAAAELALALDADWQEIEFIGRDLAVTVGRFSTDPEEADFAKVSGKVGFSIDMRSFETETLSAMEDRLMGHVSFISNRRGVMFDLGPRTDSTPAQMDKDLMATIACAAQDIGIKVRQMPCGAGHDTAVFAQQGVPSAMIFIRNANGSHNPHEAMAFDDFVVATRILARTLGHD